MTRQVLDKLMRKHEIYWLKFFKNPFSCSSFSTKTKILPAPCNCLQNRLTSFCGCMYVCVCAEIGQAFSRSTGLKYRDISKCPEFPSVSQPLAAEEAKHYQKMIQKM